MTQIVLQRCSKGTLFGSEGLLEFVKRRYGGIAPEGFGFDSIKRDDPILIQMMKEDAGKRKWAGRCSHINIVEVPDGMKWCVARKGAWEWAVAYA